MHATMTIEAVGVALLLGEAAHAGVDLAAPLRAAGFAIVEGAGTEVVGAHDLVVVRSEAPAAERLRLVAQAVADHPTVPVVATMPADATGSQQRKAVREGARGLVLDDQIARSMAATALAVAAGQLVVPPALARRLAPRPLSHREKEIMGLVVRGYTNRQIAGELFLAESTVKTHLSSALRKLDARSRAEAAALVLDPEEGHGLAILALVPEPRKIDAIAPVE